MAIISIAVCAGRTSAAARNAPTQTSIAPPHHSSDYEPLHKGSVDLGTGLYVRENEDLVVRGTPALILRRTYLSGYRASKQFGVGALHNGEEYLIGDGERFQWASLVLARGTRINFRRTTPGTSLENAEYVHDETATDWSGATLAWTGLTWLLHKADGSRLIFKGCGPLSVCSIIQSRDVDGHTIYYRRNLAGTLLKMDDGGDRWISFEYDGNRRITRAYGSTGRWVRYAYDNRGRLTTASTSDDVVYRYTYTDLDELATIEEPGTSIENVYADRRCVRQVNRYPQNDPYIFDFAYRVENGRVTETESRTSDGSFKIYRWNEAGQVKTEALGRQGYEPIVFEYERDAATRAVIAVAVTCPSFGSGPVRRTASVLPGTEEQRKADLVAECFASAIRR